MIARLGGTIFRRDSQSIVVDVAGVGYLVAVPTSTLARLPRDGDQVRLEILTHVREESIQLFGFGTEAERLVFELLLSVSGVGPRVALSILSHLAPEEILAAIEREEPVRLKAATGVGKRLAERICLELREKIQRVRIEPPDAAPSGTSIEVEAASALQHLGYPAPQAREAVASALGTVHNGATLEALLRESLRLLARLS